MFMPGFEWTGATISVSFWAMGSTKQHKSLSSSCDRAGPKPQGRQFLPQHNAPNCGSHSMEPFDPCRFFIHGLLGKVAVMGPAAWPQMVFLLRDLLDRFQPDLFSVALAVGVLWRVYPSS